MVEVIIPLNVASPINGNVLRAQRLASADFLAVVPRRRDDRDSDGLSLFPGTTVARRGGRCAVLLGEILVFLGLSFVSLSHRRLHRRFRRLDALGLLPMLDCLFLLFFRRRLVTLGRHVSGIASRSFRRGRATCNRYGYCG